MNCPKCDTPYGIRGRRCYSCEAAARWRPIPYLDRRSGYMRMRLPNRGRTVYFHRWLMEQHIGRPLIWPEVVHHINEDKTDNRLENLQLTTASEHLSAHKKGQNKAKMGWAHKHTHCVQCGSNQRPHTGRGLCCICFGRIQDKKRVPRNLSAKKRAKLMTGQ